MKEREKIDINRIQSYINKYTELDNWVRKYQDKMNTDLIEHFNSAYLFLTIAKYSNNCSMLDLLAQLRKSIDFLNDCFLELDVIDAYFVYDIIIWTLSLAYLLNIDDEYWNKVVNKIKSMNFEDKLVETIINARTPLSNISDKYIRKYPYSFIDNVCDSASAKTYLRKQWYQGHSDAPFYNSHKNDRVNAYYGYWSWETAALLKINGIDDSELKDELYYPYDAVHWDDEQMV